MFNIEKTSKAYKSFKRIDLANMFGKITEK